MKRVVKLGLIAYFLALAGVFFLVRDAPARDYELSIYKFTPPPFLWFLIVTTVIGIGVIAYHAFSSAKSRWWVAGFALLAFNGFVFLSLPYLRGYYFYAHADPIAHWAWVEEMLKTGRLHPGNIYPILHIDVANLSLFTTVSPRVLFGLLPGFLTVLWMLYTYLFSTVLFEDRKSALLTAAASSVFLFMTYQVPIISQSLGHFTFPLVFYLYFMNLGDSGFRYKVPFVALLVGMPLTHPFTGALLVVMLVILEVIRFGFPRVFRRSDTPHVPGLYAPFNINAPLLAGIVAVTWVTASVLFAPQVRFSYLVLTGQYYIPPLSELGATSNLTRMELVAWVVKGYGHLLALFVLGAAGALILASRVFKGKYGYAYPFIFLIAALIGDAFLVFQNIASGQEALYYRSLLMDQLVYFSPVIAGFALAQLPDRRKLQRALSIGAVVVLVGAAWLLSFRALYPSPWIYQRSLHITRSDIASTRWFFSQETLGRIYTGLNIPHGFATIVLGYTASDTNSYVQRSASELIRGPGQYINIPPHFGRDQGNMWGQVVPFDIAFFLSDRFTDALEDPVLSHAWVGFLERRDFTLQDISDLSLDSTVDRVYSNGATSILFVRKTQG